MTFEAPEVVIRGFERFEGVSDPDDMSIVYAIETLSGMRGMLVISAFMKDVAIRRSRANRPGGVRAA